MRGASSLGLALAAVATVWETCMLPATATEVVEVKRDGVPDPLPRVIKPMLNAETADALEIRLGLRNSTRDKHLAARREGLAARAAMQASAAAEFAAMSDAELMKGTEQPSAYHHEFHPCPVVCADHLPSNWTVYNDVKRLAQCKEPMLFDFNIANPVASPDTPTKLRVCNAGNSEKSKARLALYNETVSTVVARSGNRAPRAENGTQACKVTGSETKATLELTKSGPGLGKDDHIADALEQLEAYFARTDCESSLMFSSANGVVAGVHIGSAMARSTVSSAIKSLLESMKDGSAQTVIAQLCGDSRPQANTFGVAISASGNITAVQEAVKSWNDAGCASGLGSPEKLDLSVMEAPFNLLNNSSFSNSTTNGTLSRRSRLGKSQPPKLERRGLCTLRTVEPGDGCGSLAQKCGISASDFTKYNPDEELCSTLQPGQYVCCSAGGMDDLIPKKDPKTGICATYKVSTGDTCGAIAGKNAIKVKDIEKYNNGTTWGWYGCGSLMVDMNICLSDGKRPMPYPNKDALCGPTKPNEDGSENAYVEDDEDLTNMNPCPLNACCNVWGQCGINGDFCEKKASDLGNPGTSKLQNGCVSNCGTEIKQSSSGPSSYSRVGYYETWNFNRECLWMKAENANTGNRYTHIHWAFANVDTSGWKVQINDTFKQWDGFKRQPLKRIISFGGWGYSTEPGTYDILRQAMSPANRNTFATNIAKFLTDEGIDGVDFDWEYPGVSNDSPLVTNECLAGLAD